MVVDRHEHCEVVKYNIHVKEYILRQTEMRCSDYPGIIEYGKPRQGSHV
jgi:hypothetical protein